MKNEYLPHFCISDKILESFKSWYLSSWLCLTVISNHLIFLNPIFLLNPFFTALCTKTKCQILSNVRRKNTLLLSLTQIYIFVSFFVAQFQMNWQAVFSHCESTRKRAAVDSNPGKLFCLLDFVNVSVLISRTKVVINMQCIHPSKVPLPHVIY